MPTTGAFPALPCATRTFGTIPLWLSVDSSPAGAGRVAPDADRVYARYAKPPLPLPIGAVVSLPTSRRAIPAASTCGFAIIGSAPHGGESVCAVLEWFGLLLDGH